MALITYADKQAMGTQPSIPEVNKVTDSNMNEIKNGINNSTTYSTSEVVIGEYNNKPLYRKIVNIGTLPNNTNKSISTGLTFNSTHCILRNMYGTANYSNGIGFTLPYIGASGSGSVSTNIDASNNVVITTTSDRTSMTGDIILEYTKATD